MSDATIAAILALEANTTGLRKGLDDGASALDLFQGQSDKIVAGNEALGRSFKNLGGAIIAAFGGAKVAHFFKEALTEAASYREDVAQFEHIFRNVRGEADQLLETLTGDAFGRSSRQAMQLTMNLMSMLKGMELTDRAAADLSGDFAKMAVDIGSFTAKNPADVMSAFQSSLMGFNQALRPYGIFLTDAIIKQKIYEKQQKGITFATEQEAKAYVILEEAQRQQADAIGDFAVESGNYRNQLNQFYIGLKDLQATIGETFIDNAQEIVASMNSFIEWMNSLDKGTSKAIITFTALGGALGGIAISAKLLSAMFSTTIAVTAAAKATTDAHNKSLAQEAFAHAEVTNTISAQTAAIEANTAAKAKNTAASVTGVAGSPGTTLLPEQVNMAVTARNLATTLKTIESTTARIDRLDKSIDGTMRDMDRIQLNMLGKTGKQLESLNRQYDASVRKLAVEEKELAIRDQTLARSKIEQTYLERRLAMEQSILQTKQSQNATAMAASQAQAASFARAAAGDAAVMSSTKTLTRGGVQTALAGKETLGYRTGQAIRGGASWAGGGVTAVGGTVLGGAKSMIGGSLSMAGTGLAIAGAVGIVESSIRNIYSLATTGESDLYKKVSNVNDSLGGFETGLGKTAAVFDDLFGFIWRATGATDALAGAIAGWLPSMKQAEESIKHLDERLQKSIGARAKEDELMPQLQEAHSKTSNAEKRLEESLKGRRLANASDWEIMEEIQNNGKLLLDEDAAYSAKANDIQRQIDAQQKAINDSNARDKQRTHYLNNARGSVADKAKDAAEQGIAERNLRNEATEKIIALENQRAAVLEEQVAIMETITKQEKEYVALQKQIEKSIQGAYDLQNRFEYGNLKTDSEKRDFQTNEMNKWLDAFSSSDDPEMKKMAIERSMGAFDQLKSLNKEDTSAFQTVANTTQNAVESNSNEIKQLANRMWGNEQKRYEKSMVDMEKHTKAIKEKLTELIAHQKNQAQNNPSPNAALRGSHAGL